MATKKETLDPMSDPSVSVAGTDEAGEPFAAEPGQDVVHMASLNKDGEPDQSANFVFLEPAVGEALLALQKESQETGADMVREKGRDAVREAKAKVKK